MKNACMKLFCFEKWRENAKSRNNNILQSKFCFPYVLVIIAFSLTVSYFWNRTQIVLKICLYHTVFLTNCTCFSERNMLESCVRKEMIHVNCKKYNFFMASHSLTSRIWVTPEFHMQNRYLISRRRRRRGGSRCICFVLLCSIKICIKCECIARETEL